MSGNMQAGTNPAVVDPVPSLAGAPTPVPAARAVPVRTAGGPVGWARTNLFGSWGSTLVTLLLGAVALRLLYSAVMWGLVRAVWTVPYGANGTADTSVCRALDGTGACWAVIRDKWRFILFGRYPYDQQWRPGDRGGDLHRALRASRPGGGCGGASSSWSGSRGWWRSAC